MEADEEQVNLTRFDLFFPEKRPFFLENASTFQFGNPQQIDLFFSRRIGLSSTGVPIDILGGARLSGKVGGWNVGVLNLQTDEAENAAGTQVVGPANNYSALRLRREVGRSSYGAIFVNRQGTGSYAPSDDHNRAYGLDTNIQVSPSQRVSIHLVLRFRRPPAKRVVAHPSVRNSTQAGRPVRLVRQLQQRQPTAPFQVYNRDGRRVVIPAGQYSWWQNVFEYLHDPSARVTGTIRARKGHYYDGDFQSVEINSDYRITPRATVSLGWTRQDIKLPHGNFVNHLVPIKANYSFTNLANLSALLQYNGQTGQFSSNVRLAMLNRSGTGLFVVFNDRRDLLSATVAETLGRSFVVKYTRLVDF